MINVDAMLLELMFTFLPVIIVYIALGLYRWWRFRREYNSITAEALTLEHRAKEEETIVGFTEALLRAAAERGQLSVITAERRAGKLFRVGTLLMTVSVVVPFILVAVYLQTNPNEIVNNLKSLGVSPTDAAKVAQRDWHLLLAGVSFGLLFLAAAKGILAAESKQLEIYSSEVGKTTYYGDLARALRIAERLDSERKDNKNSITDEVIRKVIVKLLERGQLGENIVLSENAQSGSPIDHELLKIVSEALRK